MFETFLSAREGGEVATGGAGTGDMVEFEAVLTPVGDADEVDGAEFGVVELVGSEFLARREDEVAGPALVGDLEGGCGCGFGFGLWGRIAVMVLMLVIVVVVAVMMSMMVVVVMTMIVFFVYFVTAMVMVVVMVTVLGRRRGRGRGRWMAVMMLLLLMFGDLDLDLLVLEVDVLDWKGEEELWHSPLEKKKERDECLLW